MPHGTPDWWGVEPTSTVHQMQDAGELAVRLGSPVTFDRRGNVVFVDGFEDGLGAYQIDYTGTGASVVLSCLESRAGAYSAKLIGGSTANNYAQVFVYRPYPVESRVGMEASFAHDGDIATLTLAQFFVVGATQYRARVRYNHAASKLQYYDSAGNWQDLATGVSLYYLVGAFHTLKVVVDLTNGEYLRVALNNTEYDMEGIAMYTAGFPFADVWQAYVEVVSSVGHNGRAYVDDVILTQNEP